VNPGDGTHFVGGNLRWLIPSIVASLFPKQGEQDVPGTIIHAQNS
jgi:hypothetical protein